MKKYIAWMLALIMCLTLCACGGTEEETKEEASTPVVEEPAEKEEPVKEEEPAKVEEPVEVKPNYAEILPEKLKGAWLSESTEGVLTLYAFKDNQIGTYAVNKGVGAAEMFSGTYRVQGQKLNYDFGDSKGYSSFTYENEELTLTDAHNNPIKKLSAADLMGYLSEEESAANHAGVICLADVIAGYYADSNESAAVAEKKAAAQAAIKAEGEAALATLNADYDKVQQLTWYQSKSQPKYVDVTCYIYPYIGRTDDGNTWLRVALNYTDAQTDAGWLFYDTVIFSVDGKNTTKEFSYNSIQRDNDTEVWEIADFEPNADEVVLLREIANSNETIIRFQGDHQYHDHTVTQKEKTAILNVLTAYNYLSNYAE